MTKRFVTAALSLVMLAACGGSQQGTDPAGSRGGGPSGSPDPLPSQPPAPGTLPSGPPSPDVVIRESFGLGPNGVRPASGSGVLKPTVGGLDGFWVEYPASKTASWTADQEAWQFAGCSEDPHELPSPLQLFNACTVSKWSDGVVRFPDAFIPFAGLAGAYELSADVSPAPLSGSYVAIGLSASSITSANLQTSGQVWLLIRQDARLDGVNGEYELRTGGAAGKVLASGTLTLDGYNPIALRHDPIARTVGAVVNGSAIGTFDAPGAAPGNAVIEGQGLLDNFVVRAVP